MKSCNSGHAIANNLVLLAAHLKSCPDWRIRARYNDDIQPVWIHNNIPVIMDQREPEHVNSPVVLEPQCFSLWSNKSVTFSCLSCGWHAGDPVYSAPALEEFAVRARVPAWIARVDGNMRPAGCGTSDSGTPQHLPLCPLACCSAPSLPPSPWGKTTEDWSGTPQGMMDRVKAATRRKWTPRCTLVQFAVTQKAEAGLMRCEQEVCIRQKKSMQRCLGRIVSIHVDWGICFVFICGILAVLVFFPKMILNKESNAALNWSDSLVLQKKS